MQRLDPAARRWRRIRRAVLAVVAFAVIGMAAVVALAAVAMPWVVDDPARVSAFLSERLGQPVRFASMTGQWRTVGPLLVLDAVEIGGGDGSEPFRVDRAALAIDLYGWLKPGISVTEFRLDGLEVDALRESDGRWRIARLGRGNGGGNSQALLDLADVVLNNARVRLTDADRGVGVAFARVDLKLSATAGVRRVGGIARVDAGSPPLRFACEQAAGVRCWVGGRGIPLARWLALLPVGGVAVVSGDVDLDVWFGYQDGIEALSVDLVAQDLRLRGVAPLRFSDGDEIEPRTRIPYWHLKLAARRAADALQLRIEDRRARDAITPSIAADLAIATDRSGRIAVADATAELADLAPLVALSNRLSATLRGLLYESAPRGRVRVTRFERDEAGRWRGEIELSALRIAPGSRSPGIGPLAGRVIVDDHVVLYAAGRPLAVELDWPNVFRAAVPLVIDDALLTAWREADGWRVALGQTRLSGRGFAGRGAALLWFDRQGRRPTLDAWARVDTGELAAATQFWPVNTMPAPTVTWLDHALTNGRVEDGVAVIRGDLDDWPFRNGAGRFGARARVRDVDLDYHGSWPRARIGTADIEFSATGLAATSYDATTKDNRISVARARIEDFRNARLELHVEGTGTGPGLLAFVRESPINAYAQGYLASLEIGGSADVGFDLELPLKREFGPAKLSGSALLRDADLADRRWNLAFHGANGRLRFSTAGLTTDDLSARWNGDPAALSLAIGEFVVDPRNLLESSVRGDFPVTTVLAGATAVAPWFERMPGKSAWSMDIIVARDGSVDAKLPRTRLELRSDLVGTRLDLPAPLRKDAASSLPLVLSTRLPFAGQRLDLTLGGLARLAMRLPGADAALSADIAFGAAIAREPREAGFVLRGDVPALDAGAWIGLVGAPAGGSLPVRIDLRAGEIAALSRAFADTRLRVDVVDAAPRVRVDGPAIAGVLRLSGRADAREIIAEFTRLHLPDPLPGREAAPVDPSRLPALRIHVADLRLGDAALGSAQVRTAPLVDGLRVEVLETRTAALGVRGTGTWRMTAAGERSEFDLSFEADSLGRMLDALGYAGIIDGGACTIRLNAAWGGSPGQFALARAEGALSASIGPGRILDVDPGAGRLLGLVSLQAIPRRLALDFSDFFQRGMSFDSITGTFALRSGDAFTSELVVKGPSADILVSGRTGIARRDYDQELLVTPRVGAVLPVVGALAAGPVGAAAGLVAQGVLQTPLNQLSQARYRVTGTWEEPRIDLIARERVTPQPQG